MSFALGCSQEKTSRTFRSVNLVYDCQFFFFSVFNDPFSFYYHLIPPPASNIHTCIRKEVHFLLESPIQNITIWFGDESRTLALEI